MADLIERPTPGDWHVAGNVITASTRRGKDVRPIAAVNHFLPEADANRRLLVVSKELAALAALVAVLDDSDTDLPEKWSKVRDRALELLRRMRG